MKKSVRRILSLALALVLVSALAATVSAELVMETEYKEYFYDDIVMTHKIIGFANKANAMISFKHTDGSSVPNDYEFSYSGDIDYQYCPEDWVRPLYYVQGHKDAEDDSVTGSSTIISTGLITSGHIMIDASMCFETTFETVHATVIHNRPDTIYVGIY